MALNQSLPVATPGDVDGTFAGTLLSTWLWITQRNGRPARYPAPIDQYFKQLELWKICSFSAAMLTLVGNFHNSKFISEECMSELLLLLVFAMFALTVAHNLQGIFPEMAVVAMLAGVSTVIASFHIVISEALDRPHKNKMVVVVYLGYGALLVFNLYKIIKEDVRREKIEEEEEEKDEEK